MSSNENTNATNDTTMNRTRRGSVGNAVFSNLFQRSSTGPTGGGSVFPAAAVNMNDPNRRRLSVSTLGIHGTSPTNNAPPYHFRRGSMSTNSDSIDENAIEDEEAPNSSSARTAPSTPFTRRMSFGASRGFRNGGVSPGTDQGAFNWSEQLRTRAESSVAGARPSFSFGSGLGTSPPRGPAVHSQERAKSISDIPAPPSHSPKPKVPERRKPDAFQERILKGDFYMD